LVFSNNVIVGKNTAPNIPLAPNHPLDIVGEKVVELYPIPEGKEDIACTFKDSIFVGGDTQEIAYDFFTKTAGSVADCPMKIYNAMIDPANPPAPGDAAYVEITNQATIDRLKQQNELPITSTDTTGRTAVWNGQTLVQQGSSNPAVRDDFAGKTQGNTTVCPNKILWAYSSTILKPSEFSNELTNNYYSKVQVLNDAVLFNELSTVTNGEYPLLLLPFDIIRIVEDKFGAIPIDTVGTADEVKARKVAWLKANLSRIGVNNNVYGDCPVGNKVYLRWWDIDQAGWVGTVSNTSSCVAPLNDLSGSDTPRYINSDGFAYFLIYTDASNGVIVSGITLDYANIELQFKCTPQYELLVPNNPRRDAGVSNCVMLEKVYATQTTDYAGKVAGSTTENANIGRYGNTTTLNAPTTYNEDDYMYGSISTLNGTCKDQISNISGEIAQQLFSFNIITDCEKAWTAAGIPFPYGTGASTATKVAWFNENISVLTAPGRY
jgi:hypothetical protein